ncbi:MAG TPA: sigma factor-like helix-turn-helix DNA-binding protein [Tepidisphaeraceae bacterium]|jgi:DNA-binding CsgD family transcriptional regulator
MSLDNMPCGKREALAQRRKDVLEHRIAGKSHRDIAKLFGVSDSTIGNDIKHCMKQLAAQQLANAEELRAMESARLEKDYADLCEREKQDKLLPWEFYRIKDLKLRLSESRRRLFGLDAQQGGAAPTASVGLQIVIEPAEPPTRTIVSEVINEQPTSATMVVAEKTN